MLADLDLTSLAVDGGDGGDSEEKTKRVAAKLREEKLQSDIFILKKLNSAFATFHGALDETGSSNERIAAQLEQTNALLNKYINVLSQSEQFSRLIFDEKWFGADIDEATMEREIREAEEKARRKAEERALAEQRERERTEREEKERAERESKERLEREKGKAPARGSVRGVRGTRASMRGTRTTQGGGRPSSASGHAARPSISSGKPPSQLPRSSLAPGRGN